MINPQELRIGNWFYSKGLNFVCQISEIRQETVSICGKTLKNELASGLSYSSFDPIPLNEEWSVRFGFKEWTGWYYLKLKSLGDEFTLCYAPNEDLLMLNIGEKTIKYENPKVHQLQNLVFALEGVELVTL